MGSLSRRSFLQAGGTAAAGAVVLHGTAEAAGEGTADVLSAGVDHHSMTAHEPSAAEPVVVFVRDAATGEVAVLVDGDEVVARDKALVGRVQKIIRQGRR